MYLKRQHCDKQIINKVHDRDREIDKNSGRFTSLNHYYITFSNISYLNTMRGGVKFNPKLT